jgi:hypothetical protein
MKKQKTRKDADAIKKTNADAIEKTKADAPGKTGDDAIEKTEEIKRHTNAIVAGFIHELKQDPNAEGAEITQEQKLTSEPLIPDIIVKLQDGVELDYNIGRAFRSCNLIEIKSVSESFTWRPFLKLIGEAYIYAEIYGVPLSDVTATAIVTRYPRDLMKFLRDNASCYPMRQISEGILHIQSGQLLIQLAACK